MVSVSRDHLMPRPPGGSGPGFMLALLVHVGLIVALAFGVSWRAREPVGVAAELWAAVPQAAAPAAQEPPAPVQPPPKPVVKPPAPDTQQQQRDAEIAIEKQRQEKLKREAEEKEQRQKAEREKAERDRAERDKAEQKRLQKEEEAHREKLRQDQLKRMMGQVGATGEPGSTGTAPKSAGPSASYAGRVIARIRPNIVLIDDVPGNPRTEVEVRLAPDGTILSTTVTQSSGIKAWDDAVLRAFDRTQVLPRDTDGTVPSRMTIGLRPRDVKS
jgi:colicin import membrane protein